MKIITPPGRFRITKMLLTGRRGISKIIILTVIITAECIIINLSELIPMYAESLLKSLESPIVQRMHVGKYSTETADM